MQSVRPLSMQSQIAWTGGVRLSNLLQPRVGIAEVSSSTGLSKTSFLTKPLNIRAEGAFRSTRNHSPGLEKNMFHWMHIIITLVWLFESQDEVRVTNFRPLNFFLGYGCVLKDPEIFF